MMELKKASKLIFILIFAASCAKIRVTTPASNFVSPEAQGKLLSGGVRLLQQAGTEGTVSFDNDRTDNPLELRNTATPMAGAADVGLLDKLDFVIKGNTNSTNIYMLKYQVLGDSRIEAGKGNQSLSIGVGYGTQETSQSDDDGNIFSNDDADVESDITESILDLSIIYGYRPQEDTLTYAGLHALRQNLAFELESNSNATLNGEKFDLQTWAYGLTLGAIRYFPNKYYVNLELAAQSTDFENNKPTTFGFATLAIGYLWD